MTSSAGLLENETVGCEAIFYQMHVADRDAMPFMLNNILASIKRSLSRFCSGFDRSTIESNKRPRLLLLIPGCDSSKALISPGNSLYAMAHSGLACLYAAMPLKIEKCIN